MYKPGYIEVSGKQVQHFSLAGLLNAEDKENECLLASGTRNWFYPARNLWDRMHKLRNGVVMMIMFFFMFWICERDSKTHLLAVWVQMCGISIVLIRNSLCQAVRCFENSAPIPKLLLGALQN